MAIVAPTFIDEHELSFGTLNDTGGSGNSGAISVVAGDLLVIVGGSEDASRTLGTPTGGGLTYTLRQSILVANYCAVYVWTAVATSTTSVTVSITVGGSSGIKAWGFNVLRFRNAGVGASSKTNVASGAPSLGLTTTRENSAVVFMNSDWAAQDGASRTYRTTGVGTFTEQTYFRDADRYTTYNGYYANVGVVAAKTVGLTAPGSQKYAIAALEVVGTLFDLGTPATETDTAQVITPVQTTPPVAIGLASETDTAQAISVLSPVTVAIGRATETDTAQTITVEAGDVFDIGQATETDTAGVITPVAVVTVAVGRATETDTASALTVQASLVLSVGLATETDTAQPITVATTVTVAVVLASETDTAQSITVAAINTVAVAVASEVDTAQAITPLATTTLAIGVAVESDTAQPLTAVFGGVTVGVNRAAEQDSADNISPSTMGTIPLATAEESDTALSIAVSATVSAFVVLAGETDTAQAITSLLGPVTTSVGSASETDTAGSITVVLDTVTLPVGIAGEVDTAQGITAFATTTVSIGTAGETDTAQTITMSGALNVPIDVAEEDDSARTIAVVTAGQLIAVGVAVELDTADDITPVVGAVNVAINRAPEIDTAQEFTLAEDQMVGIGQAQEWDIALEIAVRLPSGRTPFSSGPCEDWEPLWCEPLSAAAAAVTGEAVGWATEVLWALSGQRFGICDVTLRPCRDACAEGYGTWEDWGGAYNPGGSFTGGPRPWWWNGVWANVCGSCMGPCSCTAIDRARLPAPARDVVEVKLDGLVMNPAAYRLDENRYLVRTDGGLWPMCQSMDLADDQPGTWSVRVRVGEDVPMIGRRAVAQLAAEFAKDCAGEECQVPFDVVSLSRQGVTLDFGNPEAQQVDYMVRLLGLRMVRLFLASYNPGKLTSRGKAYDVDRMPNPWKRVNTS